MVSTLPKESPPPLRTALPPSMRDLLRSFLSYSGQWNDSDKKLATRLLETLPADPLAALKADPAQVLTRAGLRPDPWQRQVLATPAIQILLLCSRQAGKSLTAAALALVQAFLCPGSLILLLSPSLRQSGELFRDKVLRLYRPWADEFPASRETALTLELANSSRIVSLPGDEETIRGFSGVRLLVIDEAARVPDSLYAAVRPMLAVSGGRLIALSTPFGKRGWFYTAWLSRESWHRVEITADKCPRITPEFLAQEKHAIGERWFRQEYFCSFEDMIGAVFRSEDIARAFQTDITPLFG
jgi:hypothetical protein